MLKWCSFFGHRRLLYSNVKNLKRKFYFLQDCKNELKQCQARPMPTMHPPTSPTTPTTDSPTSSTTSPPQPINYRLPGDIKPEHYHLYLNPNLDEGTFNGTVTIDLNVLKSTDKIIMHNKNLTIDAKTVKLTKGNQTFDISDVHTDNSTAEFLTISLKQKIEPAKYQLEMNFAGDLKNKIVGFYSSTYLTPLHRKRTIATSKFEPTYARQSFPCFDEPNMKARFTVTLAKPVDKDYIALSNMDVTLVRQSKSDLTKTEEVQFAKSEPMSTYLACFIVCDFKSLGYKVIDPPAGLGKLFRFTVYSTPAQINKTQLALDTGSDVIMYYIKYFQIPYPLPKLDMAAIPDFSSGAMETWGLVTYRETALLFDNKTNSVYNQQRVATVVSHELAHMWFGNLVTMDWWNDLWLNEGFATYIEYDGVDSVYPKWGMRDQFLISELHTAFEVDARLSSHPIIQTVDNPDEITAIFDTISYSKGSSVLKMLDFMVGNDVFKNGITNYLKKFMYQNAKTQDLFDSIQNVTSNKDLNVTAVMDTWTRQMGYPEVIVNKTENGKYVLTQTRFLLDQSTGQIDKSKIKPSDYNYRWTIPITYITDTNSSTTMVMFDRLKDNLELPVTNITWLKVNVGQVGYYRVNYPADMWKVLEGNYTKFSVADRTSLLNDAFNLAKAGRLNYSTALSLSNQLKTDTDYVTWTVGSKELTILKKLLYMTEVYPNLRKFVTNLVDQNYKTLNWAVPENEEHLNRLLRVTVLDIACSFGHEDCLKEASQQLAGWINKTIKELHPDIRSLVYSHGMASTGGIEEWNHMWNAFVRETDASEKLKLMNGLASVKEPWLLARFIELAWDVKYVRRQDYFSCLQYIAANPTGTPLVWDYVRENWQTLVDEFTLNDRYLGRLIPSITSSFNTVLKLQEMQDFFDKYPDAGAGKSARLQALETVQNNINWLKEYKKDVGDWLGKNLPK